MVLIPIVDNCKIQRTQVHLGDHSPEIKIIPDSDTKEVEIYQEVGPYFNHIPLLWGDTYRGPPYFVFRILKENKYYDTNTKQIEYLWLSTLPGGGTVTVDCRLCISYINLLESLELRTPKNNRDYRCLRNRPLLPWDLNCEIRSFCDNQLVSYITNRNCECKYPAPIEVPGTMNLIRGIHLMCHRCSCFIKHEIKTSVSCQLCHKNYPTILPLMYDYVYNAGPTLRPIPLFVCRNKAECYYRKMQSKVNNCVTEFDGYQGSPMPILSNSNVMDCEEIAKIHAKIDMWQLLLCLHRRRDLIAPLDILFLIYEQILQMYFCDVEPIINEYKKKMNFTYNF